MVAQTWPICARNAMLPAHVLFYFPSFPSQVMELFQACKKIGFAIPAVNVTSSSTANAVMEAAAALNSPIILQVT